MAKIIGIDLGTTNSVVAVARGPADAAAAGATDTGTGEEPDAGRVH